jgi:hypothetical protein
VAINRAPFNALVDDDGSGLTGSVWNKAAIQSVLLDPIDAATGAPAAIAWTPTDQSGAGLVLAAPACIYVKVGRLVFVTAQFSYPATANGAAAVIGGLPFLAAMNSGLYSTFGQAHIIHLAGNTSVVRFYDTVGNARTNAALSGALMLYAGVYTSQTP